MSDITDQRSLGDRAEMPIWKQFYQACDPISDDRIIARVLRRIRRPFYRRIFLGCGRNLSVHGGIAVCGGDNITLGDQVQLHGLCALYAANGKLRIGNRSAIGRNSTIDASEGEITIGEDCLIAANSVLRAADHVFIDRRIPISRQGHRSGSIVLESDVWLAGL